jgi:hypothetical protein
VVVIRSSGRSRRADATIFPAFRSLCRPLQKPPSGSCDTAPGKAYCCYYSRPRVPRIQAVGDGSTDRHIRWPLRGICSHAVGTCSPAVQTAYMPKETGVPEVCTPVHSAHCLTFCRSLAAAGLRLFLGACSCPHPRAQKERGEIRSELFPGAASCAFPNAGFLSFAIIPFPLP